MRIFLVGTNHAHQYMGYNGGAANEFAVFLKSILAANDIDLLAEELNEEALKCFRASDSTARTVATEEKLAHLFCDPTSAERRDLGIPTVEELREKLGYGNNCILTGEEELKLQIEAKRYWPIREDFWIKKLWSCPSNRCLFVLGSDHIESFSLLLWKNGIQNNVKLDRWKPEH